MGDEFSRIARIRRILEGGKRDASGDVLVSIGDDAAVLARSSAHTVLSVDAAVEHVHFERAFAGLDVIAARAFVAALSDLAAMGATPRAALSALVLPATLTDAELDALVSGLAATAERYQCPVVGGNLSRGGELSLTTTVIGALSGAALCRSGARAGDSIFVTGTLGAAALGLALLQARSSEGAQFVERWRAPSARIAEGQALLGCASACIDVSDGLLQDLAHVCEASNASAELRATDLPLEANFDALARKLGKDPLQLALGGGEDYELLYTLPAGRTDVAGGRCIGRITAGPPRVRVLDAGGHELEFSELGHQHFP